jgi:hypothetical protein
MIRHTLSHAPNVQAVWQTVLEMASDGLSGEDLKRLLAHASEVIDSWLALAANAGEYARLAAALGTAPGQLEDLVRTEAAIREVRAAAEKMAAFANRPKAPINAERLQMGRNEVEQGKLKTPEQMRAALEQRKA